MTVRLDLAIRGGFGLYLQALVCHLTVVYGGTELGQNCTPSTTRLLYVTIKLRYCI